MQLPPHVPVTPLVAHLQPTGTTGPLVQPSSCDLLLESGHGGDHRLLSNGDWENARPLSGARGVLVWAPLPTSPRAIAALAAPDSSGGGIASGTVASPLDFLAQAQGPLRTFQVLEAGAPAACCHSDRLVELATEKLVFRAVIHQPAPRAADELLPLQPSYPVREASAWAVCEWHSRSLDPVEAVGVLVLDQQLAKGSGPALYVLWQDVDGAPRAWEDFAELPDPRLLRGALGDDFRYVARDEPLLVVDHSPTTPLGHKGSLSEELVYTKPFARPHLLEHP